MWMFGVGKCVFVSTYVCVCVNVRLICFIVPPEWNRTLGDLGIGCKHWRILKWKKHSFFIDSTPGSFSNTDLVFKKKRALLGGKNGPSTLRFDLCMVLGVNQDVIVAVARPLAWNWNAPIGSWTKWPGHTHLGCNTQLGLSGARSWPWLHPPSLMVCLGNFEVVGESKASPEKYHILRVFVCFIFGHFLSNLYNTPFPTNLESSQCWQVHHVEFSHVSRRDIIELGNQIRLLSCAAHGFWTCQYQVVE